MPEIKRAFLDLVDALEMAGIKHRKERVDKSHLAAGFMALLCRLPIEQRLATAIEALEFLYDIQELDADKEWRFERPEKPAVMEAKKAIDQYKASIDAGIDGVANSPTTTIKTGGASHDRITRDGALPEGRR